MSVEPLPMERVASGEHAGVVVVRLEQPGRPVVVLDHDLIQRLEATLGGLGTDVAGLVLASASERVFVAGADLKSIQQLGDDQLLKYLAYGSRVFGMLANLPCPTVAAINGAVLGGGLEMAMHCDGLVAAPSASGKPYPVGLPECGLSICPGWGGTNLLPARMDPGEAIGRTASGKPMKFDEAVEAGLFDRVADTSEGLIEAAMAWLAERRGAGMTKRDGAPLRWNGRPECAADVLRGLDAVRGELPDTEAALAVADAVDVGLAQGWAAALKAEQQHLVRLRNTAEGKAAIEAFFTKK
jgi:enoyl-CoA hydratase/carnithine racemase